jgi:putative ABC transport system permease protein
MLKNYLKIALRNLLKYKTYSAINILGLALGLCSSILILLFVRDELNYDTFHEKANRIYRVVTEAENAGDTRTRSARVAAPWGPMLKQELPEVESFVRFRTARRSLLQHGDNTFYESGGLYADPQVFEIFSFNFIEGDPATALAAPNAMVLTKSLAHKLFGATSALGQRVTLNGGADFVVQAVLADVPTNSHFHFDFLLPFEVHARTQPDLQQALGAFNYYLYLALTPSAQAPAIENKLAGLLARNMGEEWVAQLRPYLQSLTAIHLHSDLRGEFEPNGSIAQVYILSAIAVLILLVACINFMNLATARASTRAKEIGMRKVVGAGRFHLAAQFLGEALLVSLMALPVAIGLVELTLPLFNNLLNKELSLNFLQQPDLVAILLAVTLASGLIAGSYPAFFLSQILPAKILKGKSSVSSQGTRLRRVLVVVQFAASIILLAGAITIYRQRDFISNKNLGFNREQVIAIPIDDRRLRRDLEVARAELARTPGVIDATITSGQLADGDWAVSVTFEGSDGLVEETMRMLSITHNFIELMEIPLLAGRNFSPIHPTDTESAFLVNETAAALFGDTALGAPITLREYGRQGQIVGVVKDFNFRSLREQMRPMVLFIAPENYNYFYVRLEAGNAAATLSNLKQTWQKLSADFPFAFTFLDEQLDQLYHSERRLGEAVSYFTALALIVACIGSLALASFTAELRTKEIGVRKVLGASVLNIVTMLSTEFAKLVTLANLVAWPIAWLAMSQWLQNFAYRIDLGWWMFALAGGAALLIALLTVSTQALKAALANPVEALRYE